uniref:Cyclin dependent kinase n=1 Tax=Dicyema japonicum TaxID=399803 RepID=B9ZYV9_DICJA|nr:cyclin dependent kinase [Dicyema japonicum]
MKRKHQPDCECASVMSEEQYALVFKTYRVGEFDEIYVPKKEAVHLTSLRELKYLRDFKHNNIITISDTFNNGGCTHLVMEYMDYNLESMIKNKDLSLSHIKFFMHQILLALDYLQSKRVLHRDIKPRNILVNKGGVLKLSGFWLARKRESTNHQFSPAATTLWYRAPELLYGARHYNTTVDIWSFGCIVGEFCTKNPLFPGNSEIDQLEKIFTIRGSPNNQTWPNCRLYPGYLEPTYNAGVSLHLVLPNTPIDLISIADAALQINPDSRPSAFQLMSFEFLRNVPVASEYSDPPIFQKDDTAYPSNSDY